MTAQAFSGSKARTSLPARLRRALSSGGLPLRARLHRLWRGDDGMSTAEYAIGTVAAAAFASVLYAVVTGDSITDGLTSLVERALSGTF